MNIFFSIIFLLGAAACFIGSRQEIKRGHFRNGSIFAAGTGAGLVFGLLTLTGCISFPA